MSGGSDDDATHSWSESVSLRSPFRKELLTTVACLKQRCKRACLLRIGKSPRHSNYLLNSSGGTLPSAALSSSLCCSSMILRFQAHQLLYIKYVQYLLFTFHALKPLAKCPKEVCKFNSTFRRHSRILLLQSRNMHSFPFTVALTTACMLR